MPDYEDDQCNRVLVAQPGHFEGEVFDDLTLLLAAHVAAAVEARDRLVDLVHIVHVVLPIRRAP